jgi:hypothetical protein
MRFAILAHLENWTRQLCKLARDEGLKTTGS